MIGFVDSGDSRRQILFLVPPFPQLAQTGQATRDQSQTATRTQPWRVAADAVWLAPREHVPVNILDRAIEIDHCPRGMGHQQGRTGGAGHAFRQQIDIPVFQFQRCRAGMAHPFQQAARIGPARMRHGDQYRHFGWLNQSQRKGRHARRPRDHPPCDTRRISWWGAVMLHAPRLARLAVCVKAGRRQFGTRLLTAFVVQELPGVRISGSPPPNRP